jgi:hypothetical protein
MSFGGDDRRHGGRRRRDALPTGQMFAAEGGRVVTSGISSPAVNALKPELPEVEAMTLDDGGRCGLE